MFGLPPCCRVFPYTTLFRSTGANVTFSSTLNGGADLTVIDSGTTTFGGLVGWATAPTSLTSNCGGTTASNGGGVTTTAAQLYSNNVTLGAGTTLASTGSGNI